MAYSVQIVKEKRYECHSRIKSEQVLMNSEFKNMGVRDAGNLVKS